MFLEPFHILFDKDCILFHFEPVEFTSLNIQRHKINKLNPTLYPAVCLVGSEGTSIPNSYEDIHLWSVFAGLLCTQQQLPPAALTSVSVAAACKKKKYKNIFKLNQNTCKTQLGLHISPICLVCSCQRTRTLDKEVVFSAPSRVGNVRELK